jgi:hypothetical protein
MKIKPKAEAIKDKEKVVAGTFNLLRSRAIGRIVARVERIWIPFLTGVLDGGVERGYCTANIDTELGIWTITGGTGAPPQAISSLGTLAAAGRSRGSWIRTRGDGIDGLFPPSICPSFSTSNPQTKEQQFSAGGQLLNW